MPSLPNFGTFTISDQNDGIGDSDIFELSLIAGRQYRVTVSGEVGLDVFSDAEEAPISIGEALLETLSPPRVSVGTGFSMTFVAQPDQTYFANVLTQFNSYPYTLFYDLELVEAPDDALAGVQTTASMALGETYQGTFETYGDQDWVRLDVAAGASYLVAAQAGFGDQLLVVGYDAVTGERVDLPLIGQGSNNGSTPQLGFSAQEGVDYYAIVQDASRFFVNNGEAFTMTLTSLPGDIASDVTTTLSVAAGQSVQSTIQTLGDYDWIHLETTAGLSYSAAFSFVGGGGTASTIIVVDDATGDVVETREGTVLRHTFTAQEGLSYFLQPTPNANAARLGLYEVTLDTYDDNFADNTSTTGVLSVNNSVTFVPDFRDDVDFIRLDVTGGQSYQITADNSFGTFDIVREDQLLALTGIATIDNDRDFADPRVDFGAYDQTLQLVTGRLDAEDGFDYYMVVPNSSLLSFLDTTFTMTTVAAETLDHAGSTAVIAPNQTIVGLLETRADQDWVRLDIAAGQTVAIDVTGLNIGGIFLFAVFADGSVEQLQNVFTQTSGPGREAMVTGRADATIFLQVGALETGFGGILNGVQTYSISLAPITDNITDDPNTAPILGLTAPISFAGSAQADLIAGSNFDDTLSGLGGNDTIDGFRGDDSLSGGNGFDTINGGDGDDTLLGGSGADSLFGEDGDDLVFGEAGFDQLYGGDGNDTLLSGETADRVFGGDGNDVIRGGTNVGITVDGLFGEGGNDRIFGEGGYDLLDGGDGNDWLDGGNQADNLYGRAGEDMLIGGQGFDRLFGGAGDDTLMGGQGTDGLFGQQGNDTLEGGTESDRLFGGSGNDDLDGGADNDVLYGGAGFDIIDGGAGDDTLEGNFNADIFVFADGHGNDTVTDFAATNNFERIDLSDVSAIDNLAALNLGNASAGAATQVGTDVLINTGGGNSITLANVSLSDLDSNDFIF